MTAPASPLRLKTKPYVYGMLCRVLQHCRHFAVTALQLGKLRFLQMALALSLDRMTSLCKYGMLGMVKNCHYFEVTQIRFPPSHFLLTVAVLPPDQQIILCEY